MKRLLLLGALVCGACQTASHPAPIYGSTYRIEDDKPDPESELFLDIFTTADECANAKIDEVEICRPFVDRASGESRLSFQFRDRDSSQPFPLSLAADQILVSHDRARQQTYELIPHNPRVAGQLYIVMIDGSGSMWDQDGKRINQVNRALLSKEVADAFFPSPDARTGVVLMRFNQILEPLDGEAVKIIQDRETYRQEVRDHLLTRTGGFTHLYDAARVGMTDLLKNKQITSFLGNRTAQPTLILLTDGFNNEEASDTCATNAPRLKSTLDAVRAARSSGPLLKPILFTVGLGRRYRIGDKPEGSKQVPTPQSLCGARYVDERIDSNLETVGIDHVSLAWLAEAGGGVSFVKQSYRGLAEVFVTAAAKRYEWFELHYRTPDAIYHRQSFVTRVSLLQGFRSTTEVTFRPNPWLDAPTATRTPGSLWSTVTPLRHALTVLMPALGVLVLMNFFGAAWFNAYRALFRRARPRRRR